MDFERPMNLLIFAIKGGNLEEVERILNSHPNELINRLEPQIRQPPLYFAALHSDHEKSFQLTKILVQKGSNPNFQDSLMQSIIFYVARDGKINCFDYLVAQNVQLDRPDVNGQTPIYYAARDNRYQIVKQLLQRGANVNRIDSLKSQTPLFYAAREGHLQVCKLLVQYGSNVSHADNQNKMAIHYARKTSKQEVVEFLTQQLGKLRDAKKSNTATSISKDKEDKKIKIKTKDVQPKSAVRLIFTDQKGVSRQILQSQFSELASKFGKTFDLLKNPDSITAQEIQQTLAEPSWQKSAMKVINICWKAKGGNLFHKPVNPTEYGILDYFDIIKKPMDFSLVKTKLMHNVYTSKEQFKADMNLVFNNCIVYNGLENEVAMCAIEIRNIFLESCRQHKL